MMPVTSSTVDAATITSSLPATGTFTYMWALIALPFLGFVILMLAGRRSNSWGHLLGCATVIASFALGVVLFFQMLGLPSEERSIQQKLYTWQLVGRFQADVAFQLDTLSMTFVLLITGVGALIHIYSIGYMAEDPQRRKFFAYLNLFVASMLLLVLANNYLLLYVGWEGVGVASYLLIGFWQYKPSAAAAAKKAFVVNRVGDMGLSIAIMLMFATFGTFAFTEVFANADKATETTITVIGLLLLLAAVGKSAQFPLQSWLFDAMEGPTPVSALIHAATMVTAGVYLIVRSNAIFNLTPTARTFVIVVGCISLIAGAIIGSARDEIKKALAGSTMSQIGYMVVAAGLGPVGYVFAIFQLVTHGLFKADLFLGAGSVMHGMNNEENMRRYGGLRKLMLITFITFTSGYLAIMGIPPFAAFYSKDHIIEAAFGQNFWVGMVTLLGAGLTAVYMTRIFVMTFLGKPRWEPGTHPHESPPVMLLPMIVLAIGALVGGFLLAMNGAIEHWLEPVTGYTETHLNFPVWALEAITLAFVLICVAITARQYARDVPLTPPTAVSPLTKAARVNLYGDAFNEAVFMRPGQYLTRSLVWADKAAVDGVIVGGTAGTVAATSKFLQRWQDGYARRYALTMLGGTIVVLAALLLVRL